MIVGVNRHRGDEQPEPSLLRVDPALAPLAGDAAREGRNVMPAIVAAATAGATLGEMCDALRAVWGTWRETPVF